jgi:hypothetical protein
MCSSLIASLATRARMSDLTALEGASDREIVAWIERRQHATLERWRRDLIVRPLR